MRSTPQQHVTVQSPRLDQQAVAVALGDNGVAVGEAYPETPVVANLAEREVRGLDVEIALNYLYVCRNSAEEFVSLLVGEVSKT